MVDLQIHVMHNNIVLHFTFFGGKFKYYKSFLNFATIYINNLKLNFLVLCNILP